MIAVGLAAVLRAVGVRLPQLPLPGLIQRLVLTGQRAAFALDAAAAGTVHRPAHGLSALRLALPVRLLCRRDRQSASGRAVHDRLLAGQRAGLGAGRRRRADACPAAGAASAAGHRAGDRGAGRCYARSADANAPCRHSSRRRSKPMPRRSSRWKSLARRCRPAVGSRPTRPRKCRRDTVLMNTF